MNENAERINGWAAMLGVVAAIGAYALTGQIIPGIFQEYGKLYNLIHRICYCILPTQFYR